MAASDVLNAEQRRPSLDPPHNEEPPRKGHGWLWFFAIVLIAGGAAWYYTHSHANANADAATPQAGRGQGRGPGGRFQAGDISVGVIPVAKEDVPSYLTGIGSVAAYYTDTVHTRVDGQIMNVFFKEGQFVKAGDPLVDIDPRPYQAALEQAQGQLAKDVATEADAKIDLTRYDTLFQEGVIPRQQLDSQQATVGQYDGAIQTDKANIDTEKLQLTYSHITSPIDGRVGLRLVDPGNIVHATDAAGMVVITQVQPIAVVFVLPEDNLPQVVSMMKNKQLTVAAYSRDDNSKLADGSLETIDNEIDQATGTIKLKAVFPNADLSLWPNQFVNVRLFLDLRKNALVVPSAAIQNGTQGPFVYAMNDDQTVSVKPVQVDFSENNISVIRQGLEFGQQIVVDGQDKIQAGSKVAPHRSNLNVSPDGGNANSSGAQADTTPQGGADNASGAKRPHRGDGSHRPNQQGQGQGSAQ